MAISCLILGESGTGKSTSMRNFKEDEVLLINVAKKPLPFRGCFETINTDSYGKIKLAMSKTDKKVIVIDDAQYLMANEFMRRATEKGYDKFTEIAQNFWDMLNAVSNLPSDVVVYVLCHIERDANGNEKIKTIGKMLDEKITIEGLFTIVLKTAVTDGRYLFITQNNGHDTTKSPLGLFSTNEIDNDLKAVDSQIRDYYQIQEAKLNFYEFDKEAPKVETPIIDTPVIEEPQAINVEAPTRKAREYPAEEPVKQEAPAEVPTERKRRRRV